MRVRIVVLVVLGFVLGCRSGNKEDKKTTETSVKQRQLAEQAPLFEDLEGNSVALANFMGKKVLVNFWATWCRPCLEEMPSLLRAQTILEKEDFVFLLASEQSTKIINDFKTKKNFDFTYLRLNGTLAALQISALPTTFIYNSEGEKVATIEGGVDWDSEAVIERLRGVR